jgi:hypothetical protein
LASRSREPVLSEFNFLKIYSTPAEKLIYTSSRQRLACIGPLKRLRHSSIEVLDEIDQRLMQLLDGGLLLVLLSFFSRASNSSILASNSSIRAACA